MRQAAREFDPDTNFIPGSIARDLSFNFVLNLERKGKRKEEFREICEISSELFEDLFFCEYFFLFYFNILINIFASLSMHLIVFYHV